MAMVRDEKKRKTGHTQIPCRNPEETQEGKNQAGRILSIRSPYSSNIPSLSSTRNESGPRVREESASREEGNIASSAALAEAAAERVGFGLAEDVKDEGRAGRERIELVVVSRVVFAVGGRRREEDEEEDRPTVAGAAGRREDGGRVDKEVEKDCAAGGERVERRVDGLLVEEMGGRRREEDEAVPVVVLRTVEDAAEERVDPGVRLTPVEGVMPAGRTVEGGARGRRERFRLKSSSDSTIATDDAK
jgi:hypothetical protein